MALCWHRWEGARRGYLHLASLETVNVSGVPESLKVSGVLESLNVSQSALAVSWQVLSCAEAKPAVPSFAGYPGACCTPFTFQSWQVCWH